MADRIATQTDSKRGSAQSGIGVLAAYKVLNAPLAAPRSAAPRSTQHVRGFVCEDHAASAWDPIRCLRRAAQSIGPQPGERQSLRGGKGTGALTTSNGMSIAFAIEPSSEVPDAPLAKRELNALKFIDLADAVIVDLKTTRLT